MATPNTIGKDLVGADLYDKIDKNTAVAIAYYFAERLAGESGALDEILGEWKILDRQNIASRPAPKT